MLENVALVHKAPVQSLIENRSVFSLDQCELNIFETSQCSEKVPLDFHDFVVTSMLKGKKRIHYQNFTPFEYMPGETFIVPPDSGFKVDFPEASESSPTQCIALAMDNTVLEETLYMLNNKFPHDGLANFWKIDFTTFYFYNSQDLANTISNIVRVCMGDAVGKDALIYLRLQELIIKIIQTQMITQYAQDKPVEVAAGNVIDASVQYIKSHVGEGINIKDLSKNACMSMSCFYRSFKRTLGLSPMEFVIREKMAYAKLLLSDPSVKISEVSYASGFNDNNYFSRLFKKYAGVTPKEFQLSSRK